MYYYSMIRSGSTCAGETNPMEHRPEIVQTRISCLHVSSQTAQAQRKIRALCKYQDPFNLGSRM